MFVTKCSTKDCRLQEGKKKLKIFVYISRIKKNKYIYKK